ncbi:TetR/AcrR family transcriptional regulator [Falsibacillus albus]|uniref:TetR/AcrR family transcriptional regulator n=1 Tax=Falsibacillus albus TaxID=2478915 RepID=A0A3L7JZF7_9BACI|nr:TetR/AcrR family transcriptional regulator [Falsibacillus albus]RLQ96106.1 TetR/AcrR family transcriptional regulator [Falsibacillus albus]
MKSKITEMSIRLFEKKGFSETSIQEIVDAIGVTKGTFYYYFSSKEELLMDIQLHYIEELLTKQSAILENEDNDCKGKLYEIVHLLLSCIKDQGLSAKIFFRELNNLSKESLGNIFPKRDDFRLNIEKVVREGIERKEFRPDLNPSIITFGILGMANWSYQWFDPEGELTDEEIARIFIDAMLNGITLKG